MAWPQVPAPNLLLCPPIFTLYVSLPLSLKSTGTSVFSHINAEAIQWHLILVFACFTLPPLMGEVRLQKGKRTTEGGLSGGGVISVEATVLVQQLLHIRIPIDNSDWFVAPHQRNDMVQCLSERSFESIRKSLLGLVIWFWASCWEFPCLNSQHTSLVFALPLFFWEKWKNFTDIN